LNLLGEPIERTVYSVREHKMVDVPIEDLLADGQLAISPTVSRRGYFTLQLQGTALRLQARGFIGFIPINDRVAIEVLPRVGISNLTRLLWVSGQGPQVIEDTARLYAREEMELPSLREFYAEALLHEIAQIEAWGRLRAYERKTERTSTPRGRLLMHSPVTQLAAVGFSPTVTASWFERTADIPANRCLKMAISLLGRWYAQTRRLTREQRSRARRLNTAYALFEDATLDTRLTFLSDGIVAGTEVVPSTRAYYRAALDIARMIVMSSSVAFDRAGADVRMPSLVVSMEDVFEVYVREVISSGFDDRRAEWAVKDGNTDGAKPLYDQLRSTPANPDVVIESATGRVPMVLDAKYKPAASKPDRDDLNQVLAYAVSYRAPAAVIVQPKADDGERVGLIELGSIGRLTVYQYVVNLDASDLVAEEAALVDATLGLVTAAGDPLPLDSAGASSLAVL